MTPGINTLLLLAGALGSFTCSGMTLPIYMGPTALRGIQAMGDTLSNVESFQHGRVCSSVVYVEKTLSYDILPYINGVYFQPRLTLCLP